MANGDAGGDFAGGGSVMWEIVTIEDDGEVMDVKGKKRKVVEESYHQKGRRNAGVDKKHDTDFRVILKVPEGRAEREKFLAQFKVEERNGFVEVRLPIAKTPKQVQVKWTEPMDH